MSCGDAGLAVTGSVGTHVAPELSSLGVRSRFCRPRAGHPGTPGGQGSWQGPASPPRTEVGASRASVTKGPGLWPTRPRTGQGPPGPQINSHLCGWRKPTPGTPDLQEPDPGDTSRKQEVGPDPQQPRAGGGLGGLDHRGNAGCHTSGTRHGCEQTLAPAPSQVHGPHPGLTPAWAWGPRATLLTRSSGVRGPRPRSWFSADAPGGQQ